jgi:nicotinic acid mononucleotide adenylyltransferase
MSLKTFPKSVFRFFFPKNFSSEMNKGKMNTDYYSLIGAASLKERNRKWYNFASLMPFWGMMIFIKEGKRVEAEKQGKKKK